MDVETAIQTFASAVHDLPREAMQWALDHWDEAAPELLSVVERYTSGADRSDETTVPRPTQVRAAGLRRARLPAGPAWSRSGPQRAPSGQ